jgi:hypothetical protein
MSGNRSFAHFCRFVFAFVAGLFVLPQLALAKVDYTGPASPATPVPFETASNWTATTYNPLPGAGAEPTPPGPTSQVFIQNLNGAIALTQDRTLGNFAIGNGAGNEIQTLLISANVTVTGQERTTATPLGEINTVRRGLRIGREDTSPGDNQFPWGVVQQTAGTVMLDYGDGSDDAANPTRAQLVMSTDKDNSAGSLWEVGGTASLIVGDDVRIGDRVALTSPGSIFRVRGSHVGEVTVGDQFQVASDGGLWDAHRDVNGHLQFNRGKSVAEFVLDAGGVTPVTVLDNLDIGDINPYPAAHAPETGSEYTYGFLRIKLSEPTTAGSGAVGSGNELVLFKADRITTDTSLPTGTDYDEGRFFDPDHPSASGGPHRPLFDSDNPLEPGTIYRVLADYAGAQYSWRIDYFDSSDDGTVIDAVVLSELQKTGVEGDLNGDTLVNEADRQALISAIGSFAANPLGHHDLLGAAQSIFDLNADDYIDNADRQLFANYFLPETGLAGDFNGDMKVDAADYTVWRDHLGQADEATLLHGNGDGMNGVDAGDYSLWKTNFGTHSGAGAGGLSAGAVPEPSSILFALCSVFGLVGLRRRSG